MEEICIATGDIVAVSDAALLDAGPTEYQESLELGSAARLARQDAGAQRGRRTVKTVSKALERASAVPPWALATSRTM